MPGNRASGSIAAPASADRPRVSADPGSASDVDRLHAWARRQRFAPPWWLRQPDVQTCWYVVREVAAGLRDRRIAPGQIWSFVVGREKDYFSAAPPDRLAGRNGAPTDVRLPGFTTAPVEIPYGDDGFMTGLLDSPPSGGRHLAILLHGLEGSAHATYMRGAGAKLAERGIAALRLNMINCGGSESRTRSFYHAGCTPMPAFAVRWALDQGYDSLALVGFSLGGNVVLKYMTGEDAGIPAELRGALTVSTPMDLSASCDRIDQARNKFYRYRFLKSMVRTMHRKQELFPDLFPVQVSWVRTIREFDHRYTAPANGFESASEYYRRASSVSGLLAIRHPVVILQAQDDLYIPFAAFRDFDWQDNPNLVPLLTRHGGHLGFHASARLNWMETTIADFCAELFGVSENE